MNIKKFLKKAAFTLIELLVVITIIAILAGIALPVFTSVQVKGNQTKALSNAKQIALALRLYASDNNGVYPSTDPTVTSGTTYVPDSNHAFCQLFPQYIQQEAIFWLSKSAFCSTNPPNEQQDPAGTYPPVLTLATKENEWCYVLALNDSSNPSVPLIADGMASTSNHTWVTDQTQKGGVWKGQKAIVVHADSSGNIVSLSGTGASATTPGITGPNGGAQNGDIFTTGNGANGWLGTINTVVNPD